MAFLQNIVFANPDAIVLSHAGHLTVLKAKHCMIFNVYCTFLIPNSQFLIVF